MKKWIILMITIGLSLPVFKVNAEKVNEDVELVPIEFIGDVTHELEEVELIQTYIDEHLNQSFETMYIDWEADSEGVYTYLFSDQLTDEELTELNDLAEDLLVSFKAINYTRAELEEKHLKILDAGFEYEEFTIQHMGPDMTEGRVTVGIDPYNETNAQVIYDQFGDELVHVEEAHEITTMDIGLTDDESEDLETAPRGSEDLDDGETTYEMEIISTEIEEENNDLNWFQRFWRTIRSWFTF